MDLSTLIREECHLHDLLDESEIPLAELQALLADMISDGEIEIYRYEAEGPSELPMAEALAALAETSNFVWSGGVPGKQDLFLAPLRQDAGKRLAPTANKRL
ncbi:hypothetical protein A11A3_08835 [Alcanivorax hongdengensis A-11-3]|uniref:Uncharacterized protein n=1 Tax=Alcanivorax hongdengensis A-11-3 TaxID=1177179 RepID=L0WDP7_9GAMM|nr:hypothetical protein [Alcanivorax hongdengensis]EKF74292.1 hypothetical protein A11A3_08835 [Alcanivorax hongdengensis A-11-3]